MLFIFVVMVLALGIGVTISGFRAIFFKKTSFFVSKLEIDRFKWAIYPWIKKGNKTAKEAHFKTNQLAFTIVGITNLLLGLVCFGTLLFMMAGSWDCCQLF